MSAANKAISTDPESFAPASKLGSWPLADADDLDRPGSFRHGISQLTFDRTTDKAKKNSSLCKSFTKTGTLSLLSLNSVNLFSM